MDVHDRFRETCLGVPGGSPATAETLVYFRSLLPEESRWAGFGIGPQQFPMVAQCVIRGGHVRTGLEDNLYLDHGVLAPSNAALVERSAEIIGLLGGSVASSAEAREIPSL